MIVGLTGGIGSGKTTIAEFFSELGIPVYNSDKEAKRLMCTSKKLKKGIKELLGNEAYKNEKLNKTYISSKIFNDSSLLKKMNAVVHPAVRKSFQRWAKRQTAPYVIQESALLFENSTAEFYDKIILVIAPEKQRIQRVVDRDGSSEKEVHNRLKNQLPDKLKIPLADFVLENTDMQKTKQLVNELHIALIDNC